MLNFRQAKEILAKYAKRAGTCIDDPALPQFVIQVLQYMLFSGSYGNLRKFCFVAQKNCFTVPYELETIEKIKIDNWVGTAFDKWYEFHSTGSAVDCISPARAVYEEPNYFPTVYDVPEGGSRVGVMGVCEESPDAHIIIQGIDPTGRQIITEHEGNQIVGEYLRIKKGEIRYTNATFAQITGVVKTPTNGYVNLLWINLALNLKGFLADYSPLETIPAYRRYRLTTPCANPFSKITVLGRIRLKEAYTDNDIIPFENIFTLNLAGQTVNAANNRQMDLSKASDIMAADMIERENGYKSPENGTPIEFYLPLSGGAIGTIIPGLNKGPWGGGWGGW